MAMEAILAWVQDIEGVVQSQSSFEPFQPNEIAEILARFYDALDNRLNNEELGLMVNAIDMLLYVTDYLANSRDQFIELMDKLITSFLNGKNNDEWTRAPELNREVLNLLEKGAEDKDVSKIILECLTARILGVIANNNLEHNIRASWLKSFNLLLGCSDAKQRHAIGAEFAEDVERLVDYLYTCGDYDTQSSIVETLMRFTSKSDRQQSALSWFPNHAVVQSLFVRIKDFESDCRNFLNNFNASLGGNRLVHSIAAQTCHVGNYEVFKPNDEKYTKFWIDFNLGPGSISIFYVKNERSCDL